MMLSFYIALYDISDSTTHHWALIALDSTAKLTDGPVQMFQIVTQREGCTGEDGYMTCHTSRDLLKDESAERLLCLVELPEVNMAMEELQEFMKNQPVGQKSTPLIDVPWRRWECSQWAIRAIKGLVDAGMVMTQSSKSFFKVGTAKRTFWGPMLQVACTKCAHEILARMAHNRPPSSTIGVEIMSLSASGILL